MRRTTYILAQLVTVILLLVTLSSATSQPKKLFSPNSKAVSGKTIVYTVKTGDTARAIAARFGMTLKELQTLNTGLGNLEMLNLGDQLIVSSKNGVPNKIIATKQNSYTVQSGDTGRFIADKYGLTIQQLKDLNPDKDVEVLGLGDVLVIKSSSIGAGTTKKPPPLPAGVTVYTVKSGDTARDIAARYGLTLQELQGLNVNKGSLEGLNVGDKLNVKQGTGGGKPAKKTDGGDGAPDEPKPMPGQTVVTVKAGDTAVSLAQKYKTTVKALRNMNPSKGTLEGLEVGDRLIVIPSRATLVTPPVEVSTYTVKKGESGYGIAELFGTTVDMLAGLNPDKDLGVLQPGDVLAVK